MAIADDKRVSPGKCGSSSSAILAEIGRQATTQVQNVLAAIDLPFNDAICGKKIVGVIFTRSSPVGDSDLGAMSIGTVCLQYSITSTAISGFDAWFKTAAGANGWEKLTKTPNQVTVNAAITTAGNVTYTAAQMVNGFIIRDPNGANRTDPTATAAALLTQFRTLFGNAAVGSSFIFEIANTADASETVTISAGSGVTLWPATQTLAQNTNGRFRAVFTNVTASSEAVTIYKL